MAALSPAQLSGYLNRIGLAAKHPSPPPPTLRTLADIQWAHLTTIPFENLSLRLDTARQQFDVSTDPEAIYNKLVVGKRGGYCLEQNGLLGSALRSLGFELMDAGARVVRGGGAAPEPPVLAGHDHRFLLVHLDGRTWMADVGFGSNSIPQPLLLPAGAELFPPYPAAHAAEAFADLEWPAELPLDRMQRYRLRLGLPNSLEAPDPESTPQFAFRVGYYLQRYSEGGGGAGWRDLFFFRLDEFLPADFEDINFGLTSNPASFFRCNLMMALQTAEGRLTLDNDAFRRWTHGGAEPEEEVLVGGEEQLQAILDTHFGIRLPGGAE